MRELIIAGAAALLLTACNRGGNADQQAAIEQNVETQVVATNDVTAIDAATGQAANMAADVAYMPEETEAANDAAPAKTASGDKSATKPQPERSAKRPAQADSNEPALAAEPAPANAV
ncbi:hypothetical protein G7078_08490 [Sphingomonas sinipercae]|uniref:Lipoprotein n=1 Tax=Sphingomonas sinipercae TaxID=2714944 RepID=A0A6G7ZPI4_9SPHN|nr:hypothetical protein [Sphingomonas sinipercae]QIL02816.1 hypothetical protein G7078_08490 [Sphingomonas sinipercae]